MNQRPGYPNKTMSEDQPGLAPRFKKMGLNANQSSSAPTTPVSKDMEVNLRPQNNMLFKPKTPSMLPKYFCVA